MPKAAASTNATAKRKREDPARPILAQTSMFAPPALWARGGTSNFAKTDPQNYHSKRRAETHQTLSSEEARRKAELLFLKEGKRIRKAGGIPFTDDGGLGSRPISRAGSVSREMEEPVAGLREGDIGEQLIPALDEHLQGQITNMPEQLDHSKVIVIQPGSRYLRLGRATDPTPLEQTACIFRKTPLSALRQPAFESYEPISNKASSSKIAPVEENKEGIKADDETDKSELSPKADAPGVEDKVEPDVERLDGLIKDMRDNLKQRMQAAKLKLPPGKYESYIATSNRYNASVKPIQHKAYDDPYSVEWVEDWTPETLFPNDDLNVPEEAPYECRWPWSRRTLNTDAYRGTNPEIILADIQAILENALGKLSPAVTRGEYYQYSIALVIPDHTEKQYIEAMCKVLLQFMGFREVGILQQAACATFGAGLSSACIVDVGAQRTTVTCVDDGMMLSETRFVLNYGTDDVTEFYAELLKRISIPYKELDMTRRTDREMMDDLRIRTCILFDQFVASNIWKFNIKDHKRPSIEYEMQTFDQPVMAFSCLFDPRVMNWNIKDKVQRYALKGYVDNFMTELKDDDTTRAMSKATEHLLPPPPPVPEPIYEELITTNAETGETTSTQVLIPAAPVLPVEPEFDIVDEASKMPLEVAVACSLLSAPVERIANLAGSILVLGGGGAVEGFADALRWRVLSQLQQRAPQQSISPAILPPPRGLDPRLVTWRGGVVWTKLDSMSDLWIRREEWQEIGLRSIKMRMM